MIFMKGLLYGIFLGAGPAYLLLVVFFRFARQSVVLSPGQGVGMAAVIIEALESPGVWGVILGASFLAPLLLLMLWTLGYVRL